MTRAADQPLNVWGKRGVSFAWLATVLLVLPALRTGFVMDDFLQRLVLSQRVPELGLGPATLYDFTGGNFRAEDWLARGFVPWFTDPHFAIRFFRPLGSLAVALDQALFGGSALAAHLFGAVLFMAVTAVAFALFRAVLAPNRAGLAALVFALASGHSVNLTWVAGRHVVVGGLFGALAVYLHVQSAERRAASSLSWLAALCLALSALASETCLAAVAMLVAYELFATERPWRTRALRALPWIAAACAYLLAYALAGYGVKHSALYISPFSAPAAFLAAMLTRLPILLGELAFAVPASLWGPAAGARSVLALVGVLTSALVVLLAWRGAAGGAERRKVTWFALSALFSSLPMVGGVPDGRVLLLPMLASAPLVATAIDTALARPARAPRFAWRAAGAALLFVHLLFAGAVRLAGTEMMVQVSRRQHALAQSADFARCSAGSPLFVVTGADPTLSLFGGSLLRYYRPDVSRDHPRLTVLSMVPAAVRLERPSAETVVLSVVGGKRHRPTMFERLFRDSPLAAGMHVAFPTFTATVLQAAHGLPVSVAFDLPQNACLLALEHGALVGRPLPPVGSSTVVPHEPGPLGL